MKSILFLTIIIVALLGILADVVLLAPALSLAATPSPEQTPPTSSTATPATPNPVQTPPTSGTATAAATAISTAVPSVTATSVASPTLTFSARITSLADTITNPVFALAKLFASFVAIILGAFVVWRLAGLLLFRMPNLVVDTLVNAGGDTTIDAILAGLSQQMRERLIAEMEGVNRAVKDHVKTVGPETYHPSDTTPLPQGTPDQALAQFVASLKDLAPKEISPVVQLLNVVLPPRGTKVACMLQCRAGSTQWVGITFEIADLQGGQETRLKTIWEQKPAAPTPQADGLLQAASIAQPAPATTNKEVLSRYLLGQIYAGTDDIEHARAMYEEALKQQPDFEPAQNALKELLRPQRTLAERYIMLIYPATRWLAIELSRHEMFAAEKRISFVAWLRGTISRRELLAAIARRFYQREREQYRGQVHNFFGVLFQVSAPIFPAYTGFFLDLAIKELRRAIDLVSDWYQPYENLAEVYNTQGRELHGIARLNLLQDAIFQYTCALDRAKKLEKETDRIHIVQRIEISRAIAQLRTGHPQLVAEALALITRVEQDVQLDDVMSSQFLGNLASCYAIIYASNVQFPDVLAKARRCLTYCMARDRDFWYWASTEKDLESIRDGLDVLRLALSQQLDRIADLPTAKGRQFYKAISEVLTKAGWH